MKFEYTDKTTIDDIIEHILMRLNTDFKGGALQVPDFCRVNDYDYDTITEMEVREKMYQHDVGRRSTGTGQPETAIELRPKGAQVHRQGGWKKYLIDYERQQMEQKQERENQRSSSIIINAPVTGSQIGQSSFGGFRVSHSTSPAPTEKEKQQKASSSRIEKWIVPIVVGLVLLYIEHKSGVF